LEYKAARDRRCPGAKTTLSTAQRATIPGRSAAEATKGDSMLRAVKRVGVIGDIQGNLDWALNASRVFARHQVHALLQLGDFGVVWPGPRNWRIDINTLKHSLSLHKQKLFYIDGNEDWHPWLASFPLSEDGLQWLTHNIAHIPRGYRAQIGPEYTFAAMGGANSSDRHSRHEGRDWWPAEQITEDDLIRLGADHADVLVGHEAPLHVPTLDANLARCGWDLMNASYPHQSRTMLHRALLQTRPQLVLGGHHRQFVDEVVAYVAGSESFVARVVHLDRQIGIRIGLAILDTSTLELDFLHPDGAFAGVALKGT